MQELANFYRPFHNQFVIFVLEYKKELGYLNFAPSSFQNNEISGTRVTVVSLNINYKTNDNKQTKIMELNKREPLKR